MIHSDRVDRLISVLSLQKRRGIDVILPVVRSIKQSRSLLRGQHSGVTIENTIWGLAVESAAACEWADDRVLVLLLMVVVVGGVREGHSPVGGVHAAHLQRLLTCQNTWGVHADCGTSHQRACEATLPLHARLLPVVSLRASSVFSKRRVEEGIVVFQNKVVDVPRRAADLILRHVSLL